MEVGGICFKPAVLEAFRPGLEAEISRFAAQGAAIAGGRHLDMASAHDLSKLLWTELRYAFPEHMRRSLNAKRKEVRRRSVVAAPVAAAAAAAAAARGMPTPALIHAVDNG